MQFNAVSGCKVNQDKLETMAINIPEDIKKECKTWLRLNGIPEMLNLGIKVSININHMIIDNIVNLHQKIK